MKGSSGKKVNKLENSEVLEFNHHWYNSDHLPFNERY
jgi:hypothetical protein